MITIEFNADMMLFYLCLLGTLGVVMKGYQLFGKQKK